MIERLIIAQNIKMAEAYMRAVNMPRKGTAVVGTPMGVRGIRVFPWQVWFVGPVWLRNDYEEILHSLAPLGINSYNVNSVPDWGLEDARTSVDDDPDPEIYAIATCVDVLTPFTDDAKTIDRMMTYLDDRFSVEVTG